jgi:hypothetical protein
MHNLRFASALHSQVAAADDCRFDHLCLSRAAKVVKLV